MEYRFIDESESLAHYGVLGMKWGVRKDGKPQGYQYDPRTMSKRQAKKAIKRARKNYAKSQGYGRLGRMFNKEVGENSVAVRKAYQEDLKNDKLYNRRGKRVQSLEEKMQPYQDRVDEYNTAAKAAENARTNATRSILDPDYYDTTTTTPNTRTLDRALTITDSYNKTKKASDLRDSAREAQAKLDEYMSEYERAQELYSQRGKEIRDRYTQQYKEAAVKDLGIEDVEAGVAMLEKYKLLNYRTGLRL